MQTTIKLAWKNIWRSRIRSLVVIASIIVGVWAVIFLMSFSLGIGDSYVKNAIKNQFSHLQAHHPGFMDDQLVKYTLPYDSSLIAQIPEVKNSTARLLANGMLSTGHGARGVTIKGILPGQENALSGIQEKIVEGQFISDADLKGLLVSEKLTQKFKLKLKSRVVLTFQDDAGEIQSAAYRVTGIFNTGNAMVDQGQVLVNQAGLRTLLFADSVPQDRYHEVAVELIRPDMVDSVQPKLSQMMPGILVQNYKELAPDLALMETQIRTSGLIFIGIFMLALIFGIVNTMLMAVLERYKELGMLQAIGMPKNKVFNMVVLETLFLSIVGVPIGFFLGWLSVKAFQQNGFDLSAFAKGNEQFGMSSRIFPILDPTLFIQLGIAVAITAFLASIYPALKAIKLKPVEAIRKI